MKFSLLFIFLCLAVSAKSQLTNYRLHLYGRYSNGVQDSTSYSGGSLNGEILIHDHIGLNYNFDYLVREDQYRHLHTPMGLLGGPILIGLGISNLADSDTTDGGGIGILFGLLLFALPDGASAHIPLGYHWDVSPYANLLGIDFIKNRASNDSYIKYACSFGVKTTYMIRDRWTATAFVETRKTAGHALALGGGIGFGILLGDRSESEEFIE